MSYTVSFENLKQATEEPAEQHDFSAQLLDVIKERIETKERELQKAKERQRKLQGALEGICSRIGTVANTTQNNSRLATEDASKIQSVNPGLTSQILSNNVSCCNSPPQEMNDAALNIANDVYQQSKSSMVTSKLVSPNNEPILLLN